MIKALCLFPILFILAYYNSYAHKDFFVDTTFENVKVIIKTGFVYEEINKVKIIGQYVRELSKKLAYKDTILLYFDHFYVDTCTPEYYISYDSYDKDYNYKYKAHSKNFKGLIITQIASSYNIVSTLKLVEYAINNIDYIKKQQFVQKSETPYCFDTFKSIDRKWTNKIVKSPIGNNAKAVIGKKIYGPKYAGAMYYAENNRYVLEIQISSVYFNQSFNNIIAIQDFNYNSFIIFDTDSSFYCILGNERKISQKQIIPDVKGYYRPIKISQIGHNLIAITLRSGLSDKTVIYKIRTDRLYPNIDAILK